MQRLKVVRAEQGKRKLKNLFEIRITSQNDEYNCVGVSECRFSLP